MANKVPFDAFLNRYNRWRAGTWPAVVGNICVGFFQDSFSKQGFTDRRLKKWKQRKVTDPGRGILIKRGGGGGLLGSIRVSAKSPRMVKITAGSARIPYARIHNEGGTIKHPGGTPYIITSDKKMGKKIVYIRNTTAQRRQAAGKYVKRTKAHKIKMPQRQFMGSSEVMMNKIEQQFFKEIDSLWRQS